LIAAPDRLVSSFFEATSFSDPASAFSSLEGQAASNLLRSSFAAPSLPAPPCMTVFLHYFFGLCSFFEIVCVCVVATPVGLFFFLMFSAFCVNYNLSASLLLLVVFILF